uniref:Multiple epidermal growth factor-like domains protein 10 isoform X2 n=1 Tax=Crassostrea virginica TaxID=6565 RepID=A0A8B8C255_CRAVI|nr:multiple epidermal growth factor-like domains protein 10 isoform X2 [Crassostrea virginica]
MSCSFENIALNKAAHYVLYGEMGERKDADVVVDGRKLYTDGKCLSTKNDGELLIDFGDIISIHHITTYIKVPSGFAYLGIRGSNRSDSWGYICGRTRIHSGRTVYNISCKFDARYVSLSLLNWFGYTDTSADLCEVETYGCHTQGRYGENCSIPCPQNCQEGRCDIVEGTCLGCINGYHGPRCCRECGSGTFGRECREICGKCMGNNTCHHINGTCMEGCIPGLSGILCDQDDEQVMMSDILTRKDANKSVAVGAPAEANKPADTIPVENDAQCPQPTHSLGQECGNNTFGQDCTSVCGHCSENEHCHHINGSCLNGCDPGFNRLMCDQGCMNGSFGKNCIERCGSNCISCNAVTGVCEIGCSPGYEGTFCEQKCPHGRYGINCGQTCPSNCKGCNRFSGVCEFGCQSGWKGTLCEYIGRYNNLN